MNVSQTFGKTTGIHLGTQFGGVGVVVIEVFRGTGLALLRIFRGKLLIEEIAADVVDINKGHTCLLDNFTIPASVGVVAPFYLAVRPFVTWGQRY